MSAIKPKEIRAFSADEKAKKLSEYRAELSKEYAKKAVGGAPTKTSAIKNLRKAIAKVLTIMSEKPKVAAKPKAEQKK